jgi:alkylhydroperoxidase/carboxymuconolactone decarboxylase family protein YurZ
MRKIPEHFRNFMRDYPDLGKAYNELGAAALDAGPLTRREAELVKIGIALGGRMESAVKSHCRKAYYAGATKEDIQHAIMVGVTTVGFPTMMAGLKWAESALEGLEDSS